jgi:ATP/maltotriose-dependent transcriptional regulator MalT
VLKHYRGPQARQAPPATLELIPRIEYLLIIARFRTEPDTGEAAAQLESLMKLAQAQGMWMLATELQLALAEVLWLEGQTTKAIDVLQEGLRNVTRYQAHQVLNELRQRQPLLFVDEQASLESCHQPCGRADTAETLSQRELQVLKLVALGHSNQEIADTLFISLHTVKTHTRRIHGKLRVERRTQAVAKAKALGLWG